MKGGTKAPHHWSFLMRIHQSPVDFPDKGPVMRKRLPCHDGIMQAISLNLIDVICVSENTKTVSEPG